MRNTINFDFGDIVLAPFPFTDQTTAKKRPAVVISSSQYNRTRPDVIVMAVTGQLSSYDRMGEVLVVDWRYANLLKPSVIKPILTTLEKSLVIRRVGSLTEKDRTSLKDSIASILG